MPQQIDLLDSEILNDITNTFKALGDNTRAQIVYLLTQEELNVNTICQTVGVSQSTVSHHLAKLRNIRLVKYRRQGNQIFYSVDDSHVAALFREALWHLDHVRQNIPDYPGSHPV
ncbi:MAG: metalloregulator ArsR/SmtB family transcription factor [Ardenticatenaceae bacterium]|nr:metalloregulator ArsR/SmtB family transcription factor [Ardenticatenaceae bacterium]